VERFQEDVMRITQRELESGAYEDELGHVERLLQCIARLPEKLRRVVRAGLDGARPAALAEELRTSVAAIYQLHYRANRLLRDCMTSEARA
jgi:RNA polymerase sigma-70 factor (ECF subfamily)